MNKFAQSRRMPVTAIGGSVSQMPPDIVQASALLDVTNERQLEAFLVKLIDGISRRAGRLLSADDARAVLAVVKKAAAQTLPTLAGGFGNELTPESRVATAARVYGLELEGLSAEDRDFEIARQLIRFAEAATMTATHPPLSISPCSATTAIRSAAHEFAPGLLPTRPATSTRRWSMTSGESRSFASGLGQSRSESATF